MEASDIARSVLVVDDEDGIRSLVSDILTLEGFQCYTAESGQEAFDRICSTKIDAVLSDIRMPNGGGIDLLNKLKIRNPDTPHFAVLTGFSDYSIMDIYDKGAEGILAKPFRMDVLINFTKKLFSSPPTQAAKASNTQKSDTLHITNRFPSVLDAQKSQSLAFGRGGFYLNWNDPKFPTIGSSIHFQFDFDKNEEKSIVGSGSVRWVRKSAEANLKPGIGVEFDNLDDQTFAYLRQNLIKPSTLSYIPKG